ncbi:hypothetical protein [Pseudonocardia sp.]|uniref:hypothetical protein n=1 Tax=Pseudonocardia sp. TaxID=60912 RepID=UPI00262CBC3F|nr:hypothetical protein [Pseudonocardia sp.]
MPTDAAPPPGSLTDPAVTSLAHDLGITLGEAAQRIGWQSAVTDDVQRSIVDELGDRFGGLWFDTGTSRLTIGIVSPGASPVPAADLRSVRSAGLAAVTDTVAVQWSAAELDVVGDELGAELVRVNGGGPPCALAMGQVPPLNAVFLDVPSGPLSAAQQELVDSVTARHGTKVRVRHVPGDGYFISH